MARTDRNPQSGPSRAATTSYGVLVAMVSLFALIVFRCAWLSDDAYITYRTIDNFVHGYGLRWNVTERVQSYTHPLWLFVLSGPYFLTREIYLTALAISLAISIATATLIGWRIWRWSGARLAIVAGLGVLCMSRAFVDYSTSGLENPLTHLLLAIFVMRLFEAHEPTQKRLFVLSSIAALGILNRMDTGLLFLPALGCEIWYARSLTGVAAAAAGLVPFLLWEIFSVIYYGFPFPNTAYAKLSTGIPPVELWQHGLAYLQNSLWRDPITLATIACGVSLGMASPNRKRVGLSVGVLLYLAYTVHIGGDFMSGRFFTAPLIVALMMAFEAGALQHFPRFASALPVLVFVVGWVGAVPTLLAGKPYGVAQRDLVDRTGIVDERSYYYPATGVLSDLPVSDRPLGASGWEGRQAFLLRDPILLFGGVGFAGYFAGPGTHVIDYNALGDPLLARLPMVNVDPNFIRFCERLHGACSGPWRTGHYLRNVPDGYVDTVLMNETLLVDPALRELFDRIRMITRGPIWSAERWHAIAAMNLSSKAPSRSWKRADYREVSLVDIYERHPEVRSFTVLNGAKAEYKKRGDMEKARECAAKMEVLLRDAVARHPNVWQAHEALIAFLRDSQRLEEAADQYQQLPRDVPDRMEVHYNFGVLLLQMDRVNEAIVQFRKSLQLNPHYFEAHLNLAIALIREGRVPESMASLRQAIVLRPDSAAAHSNLGAILAQEGQLDEAIKELRVAVDLDPDNPDARGNLEETLAARETGQPLRPVR